MIKQRKPPPHEPEVPTDGDADLNSDTLVGGIQEEVRERLRKIEAGATPQGAMTMPRRRQSTNPRPKRSERPTAEGAAAVEDSDHEIDPDDIEEARRRIDEVLRQRADANLRERRRKPGDR